MIKQNLDQILRSIQFHEIGYINIFEGSKPADDENQNYFYRIHDTPEKVQEQVKEFARVYPHEFTFEMAKKQNAEAKHRIITLVKFEPVSERAEAIQGTPQMNPQDIKNLHKEIRDEIRDELRNEQETRDKVHQEQREKEILQNRINDLETSGGKFAYAISMVVQQLMPNLTEDITKTATSMQGEPTQDIHEAMTKLVDVLGQETIIKLANKLTPNDPIINMVKTYANS